MLIISMVAMLSLQSTEPGAGTLWLDGNAHAVEVTFCSQENQASQTAGAMGEREDGSEVSVRLQRWPGLHALSVVYDNHQWVHRGPEDAEEGPRIASWDNGELSASGTVAVFPPIRNDTMEVRFAGRCP